MGFEEILLNARKDRALSLREAAAMIGISHTYLSALEKGRDPRNGSVLIPSQEVLLKICNAYDLEYSKAVAYFSIYNGQDFYTYLALQLNSLKKTDPHKFKEILELIYAD